MNASNGKSVLDNVPVVEGVYRPSRTAEPRRYPGAGQLGIVGNCPRCGAAVYGARTVTPGQPPQPAEYSCDCRGRKSITESMETK